MKESLILKSILQYLNMIPNVVCWRCNNGAVKIGERFLRFSPNGIPDILGFVSGGRFLAIEVKSKSGKLSKEQKEWRDRMESYGCIYILARSIEDVINVLQSEHVLQSRAQPLDRES